LGDCGCKSAQSCSGNKGRQATLIAETIGRMYPTRRWGEVDDAARLRAGVPAALGERLARAAKRRLGAPTWFRAGGEDELCDWLWILCVGRQPSLLELREGLVPTDAVVEQKVQESYLRVVLSSLMRAATMQEVQMRLRRLDDGSLELQERTRDGVFDPVLLKRMQKVVDLLVAANLVHLDFGMLREDAPAEPPINFGDYSDRYGAPPSAVALLFYPQPAVSITTLLLEAS